MAKHLPKIVAFFVALGLLSYGFNQLIDSDDTEVAAPAAPVIVDDAFIDAQRKQLAETTDGAGFGPQAPRDLSQTNGTNTRIFAESAPYTEMNLCNIHFHEGAEHRGGDFTTYIGNGDGAGYGTGFGYDGDLSAAELAPLPDGEFGDVGHGGLVPGDTIELHYVHTSAQVQPGPTLGACLSPSIGNPQLRVETQVYVLVNDSAAADFVELTEVGERNGYAQAVNIPNNTGTPIEYAGSTTGPSYNETGSPFQVSWSVRPQVMKVDISTVKTWFEDNIFAEDHAHAVRNLVLNPNLLAPIGS